MAKCNGRGIRWNGKGRTLTPSERWKTIFAFQAYQFRGNTIRKAQSIAGKKLCPFLDLWRANPYVCVAVYLIIDRNIFFRFLEISEELGSLRS